jgi:hypothetical protein
MFGSFDMRLFCALRLHIMVIIYLFNNNLMRIGVTLLRMIGSIEIPFQDYG